MVILGKGSPLSKGTIMKGHHLKSAWVYFLILSDRSCIFLVGWFVLYREKMAYTRHLL
jgi:hypothetical protein